MKTKRMLSFILSISILLAILLTYSNKVYAYQELSSVYYDKTNTYGYRLDENGNALLASYKGNGPTFVIPSKVDGYPITYIGTEVVVNSDEIKSITIPGSIKDFDERAFAGLPNLESVVISNGVTFIGNGMFSGCEKLTSVSLPSSLKKIGSNTFEYCPSLQSITIPNGVTHIGEWAFAECRALSSLNIPNSVIEIGDSAFRNCTSLKTLSIPSSVTLIDYYTSPFASENTTLHVADNSYALLFAKENNLKYTVVADPNRVAVSSVSLEKTSLNIGINEIYKRTTPIFSPSTATNKAVTWKSSDKSIATVDEYGNIEPVSLGTATITVTTLDGNKTATCTVTVVPEVVTTDTTLYDPTDKAVIDEMVRSFGNIINVGVVWSESEPKTVIEMDLYGLGVKGALDVSGLKHLVKFSLKESQLTSINASGLTLLKVLDVTNNAVTAINVSGCTALTVLNCSYNRLATLDLSGLTSLRSMNCSFNYITTTKSLIGLDQLRQYVMVEFAPQYVKLSPYTPPVKTTPPVNLSIYEKNESTTFTDAAYVTKDGDLWCTKNLYGKPLSSKSMSDVVAISSNGKYGTLAIKKDGSLWGWGMNNTSLLAGKADPFYFDGTVIKIMDNNVTSVSVGGGYALAVLKDGSLWGWGSSLEGVLGNEVEVRDVEPFKIMDGVASAYADDEGTCTLIIKKDGTLWGMGRRVFFGLEEYDSTGCGYIWTPMKLMDNVASASIVKGTIMAIKKDGTLWGWGDNSHGQVGVKTTVKGDNSWGNQIDFRSEPIKIMDNVVFVAPGLQTLAIKNDSSLWGWGNNAEGELSQMLPMNYGILPTLLMHDVASVATEEGTSIVLRSDGTLIKMGYTPDVKENILLPNASPTPPLTATPTASKVLVNGTKISFDAYNIQSNNYFKLRDLAKVLSGSEKQFEVTWDGAKNAINLIRGKSYTVSGGELAAGDGKAKTPTLSTSKIYIDGTEVQLTAYNINGNNYFKLRDVMQKFNVGVGWDGATSTITIDTKIDYTP